MVRTLLTPGDYLMKLDLKDAYFTVLIYEPHKKYLRFQFHLKDAYFTDPIYEPHRNKDCDLPRRYSGYASGDQNHQEMIKIFHMLTGLLEIWGS